MTTRSITHTHIFGVQGRLGHEVGDGQPRPVCHDGEDADVHFPQHGAGGAHPVLWIHLQFPGIEAYLFF